MRHRPAVGTVESVASQTGRFNNDQTNQPPGGLLPDESGATAVEYGIMIAAIAAVIVATVFAIGGEVRDSLFSNIDTLLDTLPN